MLSCSVRAIYLGMCARRLTLILNAIQLLEKPQVAGLFLRYFKIDMKDLTV
jgi:hypothetical protein